MKFEISPVASLDMIISKIKNNKGTDQSAGMLRLVCPFVVRKPDNRFSPVKAHLIASLCF